MFLKIVLLSFCATTVLSEKVRYDNYTLHKISPQNEQQLGFLMDLYQKSEDYGFWLPPSKVGQFVSLMSPPEFRNELENMLLKEGIPSEVTLKNIQETIEEQHVSRKKRDTRQLYWTSFQTLDDIYGWFDELAADNDFISVVTAGQSYEGRNISGIKISRGNPSHRFVLVGGEIGADWLSPTVITYIVNQLVEGKDPEALAASREFEWHIFPTVNPDGFEYTENSVRLWYKNRKPTLYGPIGVDLTKNWNSHWGVKGVSFNPADSNYGGLGPFSEPETRLLSEYIESIGSNLVGLIAFRAFGQRLVIPFAHTEEPMENYNDMIIIGRRAMGSLAVKYNTQYLVGTSGAVFDGSTGTIADWAKYRFNPPIVATYQLRDDGRNGYLLPAAQVLPSCEETFDSLMAIIREAKLINVL